MSSFNAKFMKLVLAEVEAAFLKAATPDADVPVPEFETAEAARDHFRTLFMAELNTRLAPPAPKVKKSKSESPKSEAKTPRTKKAKVESESVEVPVMDASAIPLPSSPKPEGEKKKRAPMSEEAKAAAKAKREATKAAKAAASPKTESDSPKKEKKSKADSPKKEKTPKADSPKKEKKAKAESPAASPTTEGEKKKRAPMSEEAKAAMKAKRAATKAAKAGSPKPVEEPNLKKMDPTWKKHLKTVAKAQSKEVSKEMEAELLSYLNGLTKEEFAGKKAEEHVSSFLKPQTASNAAAEGPVDLDIVEFNGRDYYVNPETKRVYEGEGTYDDDTGAWTSYKPVGYVGMAAFEEMTLE